MSASPTSASAAFTTHARGGSSPRRVAQRRRSIPPTHADRDPRPHRRVRARYGGGRGRRSRRESDVAAAAVYLHRRFAMVAKRAVPWLIGLFVLGAALATRAGTHAAV